jgi:hypothetical protein
VGGNGGVSICKALVQAHGHVAQAPDVNAPHAIGSGRTDMPLARVAQRQGYSRDAKLPTTLPQPSTLPRVPWAVRESDAPCLSHRGWPRPRAFEHVTASSVPALEDARPMSTPTEHVGSSRRRWQGEPAGQEPGRPKQQPTTCRGQQERCSGRMPSAHTQLKQAPHTHA